MNRRCFILSGLCVLAAVAAGCTPLRGSRPAAPVPPPLGDSRAVTVEARGSGAGVVPAGGLQPGDTTGAGKFDLAGGQPVGGFPSSHTGQALQPPRPLPPPPGPGAMVPPPIPGALPVPVPGPHLAPLVSGDPHVRTDPTVYGSRLNLAPHEYPTDRVLELSRQLELVLGQNRELVARLKELESLGIGREQALTEALREVEAAEAEVARTRGTISAQKSDIAILQEKIRQMEREDIDLLKLVIAALEKLLPAERRAP